jgi:hypothetical protein
MIKFLKNKKNLILNQSNIVQVIFELANLIKLHRINLYKI